MSPSAGSAQWRAFEEASAQRAACLEIGISLALAVCLAAAASFACVRCCFDSPVNT